jgi:hypothetical protein
MLPAEDLLLLVTDDASGRLSVPAAQGRPVGQYCRGMRGRYLPAIGLGTGDVRLCLR